MDKSVISPPNLELFLARLNEEFGQYLVLRGYDHLPNGYTNDIDVYIPRTDLARFFACVNSLIAFSTPGNVLLQSSPSNMPPFFILGYQAIMSLNT